MNRLGPNPKLRRVSEGMAPHNSSTSKYRPRRVIVKVFEGQGKGKPKKQVFKHVTNCSPNRTPKAIRRWAKRKFAPFALPQDVVILVGRGHK